MVDIVNHSHKMLPIFHQGVLIACDTQPIDFSFLYCFCNSFVFLSDDIYYRTRTDSCIQIIINLIKTNWITNIDGYLFGP